MIMDLNKKKEFLKNVIKFNLLVEFFKKKILFFYFLLSLLNACSGFM